MSAEAYKQRMLSKIRRMSDDKIKEAIDEDETGFLKDLCEKYGLLTEGKGD